MKNDPNNKNIFISLIFTESTASLLNLNAPHLDTLHPDDSNVCLISPIHFNDFRKNQSKTNDKPLMDNKNNETPTDDIFLKISSNTALFSTLSYTSLSSRWTEEVEDKELQGTLSKIFEEKKVYILPMASARSTAHSNNLGSSSTNIYVSLLDSGSSSSSDIFCRICHGGESFDDLLTPCRCRGSVALVHLKCLERWLKESNHSTCELCKHHYKIIREPKYSVLKSIFVFLRHPGEYLRDILLDVVAFSLYTPSAVASTYMLMMICEHLAKSEAMKNNNVSSHIIAFSAVFGMAAIDFTYASWLLLTIQKHMENWRDWYNVNSEVKVVLPKIKRRPHRKRKPKEIRNATSV